MEYKFQRIRRGRVDFVLIISVILYNKGEILIKTFESVVIYHICVSDFYLHFTDNINTQLKEYCVYISLHYALL